MHHLQLLVIKRAKLLSEYVALIWVRVDFDRKGVRNVNEKYRSPRFFFLRYKSWKFILLIRSKYGEASSIRIWSVWTGMCMRWTKVDARPWSVRKNDMPRYEIINFHLISLLRFGFDLVTTWGSLTSLLDAFLQYLRILTRFLKNSFYWLANTTYLCHVEWLVFSQASWLAPRKKNVKQGGLLAIKSVDKESGVQSQRQEQLNVHIIHLPIHLTGFRR